VDRLSVDIPAGAPATVEIKLAKARNLAAQLSNAEWLISAPGDDRVKSFLPDCVGCHTLQRVFTSPHTAEEWEGVFQRMARYRDTQLLLSLLNHRIHNTYELLDELWSQVEILTRELYAYGALDGDQIGGLLA
jgi:hypothetical protein